MVIEMNSLSKRLGIMAGGVVLALGASACGSGNTPNGSASTQNSVIHQKAEAHAVDVTGSHLSGVDVQINLSSSAHGAMTSSGQAPVPVAPGAVGNAGGNTVISLPISNGHYVFDRTDHHLTGLIDTTGGLRLSGGSKPTMSITDVTIDLTHHTATATINGTPDVPLFSLAGTANISIQGVHTIITGLTATVSPQATPSIKAIWGTGTVGTVMATATSAK